MIKVTWSEKKKKNDKHIQQNATYFSLSRLEFSAFAKLGGMFVLEAAKDKTRNVCVWMWKWKMKKKDEF